MFRVRLRPVRLNGVWKLGTYLAFAAFSCFALFQLFQSILHPQEVWEKPTLINLTDFQWLLHNPQACDFASDKLFLILILSSRGNFGVRQAIRQSWGNLKTHRQWSIRPLFLLGSSPPGEKYSGSVDSKLWDENHHHGDLIQGNFVDSYQNLTYKTLMGYKWVLNFCANATFILKTDDDFFVNVPTWIKWFMDDEKEGNLPNMYCHPVKQRKPVRNTTGPLGKWYTSWADWPEEYFPTYCSGQGVALDVTLMRKLYSVSVLGEVKYSLIEDLFITGMLLKKMKEKYLWSPQIKELPKDNRILGFYYLFYVCFDGTWNNEKKETLPELVYTERQNITEFRLTQKCLWDKARKDHGI